MPDLGIGHTGTLRRHDMIRIDPQVWAGIMAQRPDLVATPILTGWCERGWPLVHRRGLATDAPDELPLGLPLPPSMGKRRLCFTVARKAIRQAAPPPLLRDAASAAPPAWRDTLDRLVALTPAARVFGSLAWQHLTALQYLGETSDLDVLWPLPATDPSHLLESIAAIAKGAPMRIDGELLRADGCGANWQEMRDASEVLVKRPDGAVLMPRHDFLARA